MATGAYFGVGNSAKKISKIYFGVGNAAKKVTKGYIGVGNAAKLFFSAGPESATLSKKTTLTLATARFSFGAASVGNYALFAGGGIAPPSGSSHSSTNTNTVETFNKSLTRGTTTSLPFSPRGPVTLSTETYAIIGGGVYNDSRYNDTNSVSSAVAYDSNLTQTPLTMKLGASFGGPGMVGTTFNGVGVIYDGSFSTGYNDEEEGYEVNVRGNLVKINSKLTISQQFVAKSYTYAAGGANSAYAVFGGGSYPDYNGFSSTAGGVDTGFAVNKDFTKQNITMSSGRLWHTGGSVNNTVIIAGGYYYDRTDKTNYATLSVDGFNTNLTRLTLPQLEEGTTAGDLAASAYGHHIISNGGTVVSYNYALTKKVETTTIKFTRETQQCATALGNYAFIHANGLDNNIKPHGGSDIASNKIEVYLSE